MTEPELVIDITIDTVHDIIVATITGGIDLSNADHLFDQLTADHNPNCSLLIDLTAATYIDSAGLNILNQLAFSHHNAGTHMGIAYEPGSVANIVLTIAPLPDDVQTGTHSDVLAALTAGCDAPTE